MIVECKNCLKKFTVKDSDIPSRGRTVQCGNCSSQWLQMPIHSAVTTDNLDVEKKSSKISRPWHSVKLKYCTRNSRNATYTRTQISSDIITKPD